MWASQIFEIRVCGCGFGKPEPYIACVHASDNKPSVKSITPACLVAHVANLPPKKTLAFWEGLEIICLL